VPKIAITVLKLDRCTGAVWATIHSSIFLE